MSIAALLAIIAFCVSVFRFTNFTGLALGGSLAFVILLLGYVVCWLIEYFQKPKSSSLSGQD
jgi:antibiotic biosynthesis monooxygenase (ABM) superfamily enzyme